MEHPIKAGDKVRLKAGEKEMVVGEISGDGQWAICYFEKDGTIEKITIPVVALIRC